jgi:hypothetical protein
MTDYNCTESNQAEEADLSPLPSLEEQDENYAPDDNSSSQVDLDDCDRPNLDLDLINVFEFNKQTENFYTASQKEIESVQENLNYQDRGIVYQALENNIDELTGEEIGNTAPVYRFLDTKTGTHFYTINAKEKENIEDNLTSFVFEGISFFAMTEETTEIEGQAVSTIPVYRYLDGTSGNHLFSIDDTAGSQYTPEGDGVAFYVVQNEL